MLMLLPFFVNVMEKRYFFKRFPPFSIQHKFFCAIVNDGTVVATLPSKNARGINFQNKFAKWMYWAFYDIDGKVVLLEEGDSFSISEFGQLKLLSQ